jgi:excisionase family DNA binding protein
VSNGDLTLKEAAAMLGVGRNRMSVLLREGLIAGRKVGRIWLVTRDDLVAKRDLWDREGWPWRRW